MPELPEVETVRLTLAPAVGARVVSITHSGKPLHMNKPIPIAAIKKALVGRRLTAMRRIGKYLLVDVDGPHSLMVHLGMSGRFRIFAAGAEEPKHTHLVARLDDGRELRFTDPRRFGQLDVVTRGDERAHPGLAGLGPDALVDGVDPAHLLACARGRATTLKSFLLDQSVVAGVGNIYASEALWRAKIRPTRRAKKLTPADAKLLARAVRDVLLHALRRGGTSLKDFVDADGREGENAEYLRVYDRAGGPCPRCRTSIIRKVIQGRATYFCPTCQLP
jgi:formamidopyrimidine-DNA glycosylase